MSFEMPNLAPPSSADEGAETVRKAEPEIYSSVDTYVPSGNAPFENWVERRIPESVKKGRREAGLMNEPISAIGEPPVDVGGYTNEGASSVYIPGYDEMLGEPDEWKRVSAPPLISEAEIIQARAEAQIDYEKRLAEEAAKKAKLAPEPKPKLRPEDEARIAKMKALIAQRKQEAKKAANGNK